MSALSDSAINALAQHVSAGEHVFLVCRAVSSVDVVEELNLLHPTNVFPEGTLTFTSGSCIFVRSDMEDRAIAVIAKTSGNLNIYVL